MDSTVMFLHTVSAVGVKLPTLSRGSGGCLDHLTNRASPVQITMMLCVHSAITIYISQLLMMGLLWGLLRGIQYNK